MSSFLEICAELRTECRRSKTHACSPSRNVSSVVTAIAATLGGMLTCLPCAQAEVRVTGGPRALKMEADDASIEDVLAALKNSVGLKYHSAVRLDQPFTGRFTGSLDEVVVRVLFSRDYSYVYKRSAEGPTLEIIAADPKAAGASGAEPRTQGLSAPQPGAAERHPASVSRARFCALDDRASKIVDSTQALMRDATLRYGDVIVTDEGLRVFEGSEACPHAISDFRTLSETRDLSRGTRTFLAEIERALKTKYGGRGDRPIVATDPASLSGR